MKLFLYVLSLVGFLAGCGGGGVDSIADGDPSYVKVRESLREASSRVLDGLRIRGSYQAEDVFHVSGCESDSKEGGGKLWEAAHFWQIDEVNSGEVQSSIDRLRDSLEAQGWTIVDFARPPQVKNTVVRAQDPKAGYVVRVIGVQEKSRVAVRVSAPCFRASGDS
ncbi:hypothetical protein [Embleya sp. NPDC050493]|uniref:hypothetical protein n=1 Tax=Embleya sp. NPDC050493 TaxID=3363989 RepID=UPI0037B00FFB